MGKNMKKRLMPFFITLILMVSMIVILPSNNVLAAAAIDEVSKTDDLTCGEEIWVNASGLTEDTRYYIKIENETGGYEQVDNEQANDDGEISVKITVPYRSELGDYTLRLNNSTANLDSETLSIDNTFWVKYLAGSTEVDYYTYDRTYTGSDRIRFEIYNWTGNRYELYTNSVDITVFLPNGSKAPQDPADIDGTYTNYFNTTTDNGFWNIPWYLFNFTDGNNLETEYHVNVTDNTNGDQLSNATLPIKLNMTANMPSDAEWGDTITVDGFVLDGDGNGVSGYGVALYAPSGTSYVEVDSDTTYPNGEYTLSRSSDVAGISAGTWYIGTLMTVHSYRIDETDTLDITDFIAYDHFEVATLDTAKVALESPDEVVEGFEQSLNISVYNNSAWDNDSGNGYYYDEMWIHLTGVDCYYDGTAYEDDDVVVLGNSYDSISDNKKYAYYNYDVTFNDTGTCTIIVTYDQNNTFYEDNSDLEANITGSTTFLVGSPGDMTVIISDMVEEVSLDDVSSCCKQNETTDITVEIYGDNQSDPWNASLEITGCGIDMDYDEDDLVDEGYYVSQGEYSIPISPKYAGTITVTATNNTENKSVSKDFSVSGLSGSVTTAVGDDKEISVETTEKITMTVNNGQYANVYLCYFDSNWENEDCLNDTTGDGTEGNGLNGVFSFTPDVEILDHVGYIVCAANAGDYWMYDIVEVAPVHDLVVDIIDPTNTSMQTLTVGLENNWEFKILDGDGDVVGDIDTVTAEILDEDGDTLQEYELSAKSGDIWYMDDWIPHFAGDVVITAVNNTDENEHDGNVTYTAALATITYSPIGATAGIGKENVTVSVTALDANGQPLPDNTKLYINIENEDSSQDIPPSFNVDENGEGEFDITEVGDNKTQVNVTLQDQYSSGYKGNLTDGHFMIDFPDFIVDPDTIYINRENTITITANDQEGNPIEGINLTLIPTGIIGAMLASGVPDPVMTDADGQAIFSIQPTASGTLNVTIAQNIGYNSQGLLVYDALLTDSIVTVTALKQLKISLSQSPVYEGDSLTVTVKSGTDPVSGADVEFAGTTKTSDASGEATFTAPDPGVESVVYTVSAEKTGYMSAEKSLTVIKIYDITVIGPSSNPGAGETFTVTVLAKGSPLAGATVTFNGKTSTSGGDGKLTLTAPSEPGDYTLEASYEDYTDFSMTVTVKEGGGVPGFELLTLVVAFGAAFILLRRRRQ